MSFYRAFLLVFLALGLSWAGIHPAYGQVVETPADTDYPIYLPIVAKDLNAGTPEGIPRVNLPYFPDGMRFSQAAIHWFGEVRGEQNYTDIRLGYTPDELVVQLAIFDRHTWYDTSPTVETLTEWDAAELYLDTSGAAGSALSASSYRFVGQLNSWEDRGSYQAVYRGGASGWSLEALPFTTEAAMRGVIWNDNSEEDRGWLISYRIPFTSLGLANPPAPTTMWRLAVTVHDRDDSGGTPIAPENWPENLDALAPGTWGLVHFGLPQYSPPGSGAQSTWVVRHNLDGADVPDAGVGGDTTCGDGLDFWNEWGDTNYAHEIDTNIQNQSDLADWPCFSKHYVTFPLDSLPPGRVVVSATLTLHQFGGSNPAQAQRSLIQVLTVGEAWSEATITWNNAPLALENVSRTWVDPLPAFPGWPGVPSHWDLSRAVSQAYADSTPLRLALYSADAARHSGKYFSTSDVGDWNAVARPTLTVLLGEPLAP